MSDTKRQLLTLINIANQRANLAQASIHDIKDAINDIATEYAAELHEQEKSDEAFMADLVRDSNV